MLNERIIEKIVKQKLRNLKYYEDKNIVIDEQITSNENINKLLKKSK